MNLSVSIIIPTHNRHNYLTRILNYYLETDIQILVVDSSVFSFKYDNVKNNKSQLQYFHLPNKSLTSKISFALDRVTTPFIVMCADDDFIIPAALIECVDFLIKNSSYSAAIGNAIYYKKEPQNNNVDFFAFYTDRLSFSTSNEDPIKRLHSFFNLYRTVFYALHRTMVLKKAFEGADKVINNLFLNEYITAIYPLTTGHFIELPILYHVREYSLNSGDKIIESIDAVFYNEDFKTEFDRFIIYHAKLVAQHINKPIDDTADSLRTILMQFSKNIYKLKHNTKERIDKKIGKLISLIPFLGSRLITTYRKSKSSKALASFVRSQEAKKQLATIKGFILKYKID